MNALKVVEEAIEPVSNAEKKATCPENALKEVAEMVALTNVKKLMIKEVSETTTLLLMLEVVGKPTKTMLVAKTMHGELLVLIKVEVGVKNRITTLEMRKLGVLLKPNLQKILEDGETQSLSYTFELSQNS